MGIVSQVIARGNVDWPWNGAEAIIEENPGEEEHIHIHMGWSDEHGWAFRMHFTYDEFNEFSKQILKEGKLEGSDTNLDLK